MFDFKTARQGVETLHRATSSIKNYDKDQVETFINVGEYGLALDTVAWAYIENKLEISADLFEIFEKLVGMMDLLSDPEYDSVAELLKRDDA